MRYYLRLTSVSLSLITIHYPDDADGDQEVELIQFHLYSTKSHQSPLGALMTPALLLSPERWSYVGYLSQPHTLCRWQNQPLDLVLESSNVLWLTRVNHHTGLLNEHTSETQWSHPDGDDNNGVGNHKLVVVLRGSWSHLLAQPRIRWWRHEQVFIRPALKCNKTLISQQRSPHWGGVGSFSPQCISFWSSRRFTCPYMPHPLNCLVFSVFM